MTLEQINLINESLDTYDQGIFTKPYGVKIDEPVVYMKVEAGGVSGGSCWDSSDPQPYESENLDKRFYALDKVLKILYPNLSYLDFRELENLIVEDEISDYEYYGNQTDYLIKYITVSKLEEFLSNL